MALAAALYLAGAALSAQPGPVSPEQVTDSGARHSDGPALSLREVIRRALESNLLLQVQRIAPEIQEQQVVAQEAAFDPTLFSQANIGQSELAWNDADGLLRQTTSDSRSYVAGITKRLATTGAQVTASAAHSRNVGSSFNPDLNQLVGGALSERASVELEITQPLLRNRGSQVNLAPLRGAQARERAARLELRNLAADLLQDTENAYWQLSDAYARRALRETNRELAQRLLSEAREREQLGLATRLDVLQAEANLAQREEEIIRAEQAIADAADVLLAAMGALEEETAIAHRPTVDPMPLPLQSTPDYDSVIQTSLERNFDAAIQREILEQLEQERILARNQTRPELDVSLAAGYNGLSPFSARDAFSEVFDRRGDDWGLRLSFNLPWGRRSSRANARQADLRIDQAEYQMIAIKQDLLRSVRSAWRRVALTREQLRAAELSVSLQEATYEQEQGRYEEGLSTVRDLLEIQRDLDNAAATLLDAKLNAVQAEVELARVQGLLLERHGLRWEAVDAEPLRPSSQP